MQRSSRDNGAVIVIDGGAGYGQVVAKEAMDIGIDRAKKHGVCVVGLTNAHHIGRIGHWAEQCARAGMVSTHWVNVHGHKSLVAPFGGAEPRFTTNPYCTAVPRKGKEPIVLDFATSQVAMGKVRVANNKKVQMEPGLLIDAAGKPTTDPGVMYNPPYGAILPFGLHKGGGLAVICDLLAGALTGGRTHSPRTIKKDGTDIINNMLSIIIDPASMGGTAHVRGRGRDLHHLGEVGQAAARRGRGAGAGRARARAQGRPREERRADRRHDLAAARRGGAQGAAERHRNSEHGRRLTAPDDRRPTMAKMKLYYSPVVALRPQGAGGGDRDRPRQEDRDGQRRV